MLILTVNFEKGAKISREFEVMSWFIDLLRLTLDLEDLLFSDSPNAPRTHHKTEAVG